MINNLNLITLGINWQKYFHMVDWDRLAMTILEKVVLLILFTILFLVFKRIGKGVINHFFKRYRMKYQNTVAEKRINVPHVDDQYFELLLMVLLDLLHPVNNRGSCWDAGGICRNLQFSDRSWRPGICDRHCEWLLYPIGKGN